MTASINPWPPLSILGQSWQRCQDTRADAYAMSVQVAALREEARQKADRHRAMDYKQVLSDTDRQEMARLRADVADIYRRRDWLVGEEGKLLAACERTEDRYAHLVGEWRTIRSELERLQSQRPCPIAHIASIQSRINDLILALEVVE